MDRKQTQTFDPVAKGLAVLRADSLLVSARVHRRGESFEVWINGAPIAETDSQGEGYRLLAAIFLRAGNSSS